MITFQSTSDQSTSDQCANVTSLTTLVCRMITRYVTMKYGASRLILKRIFKLAAL